MPIYKIISLLLCYPQQDMLDGLTEIEDYLQKNGLATPPLQQFLVWYRAQTLLSLQENYVQTFDQTPSQSLHLFEHLHGEDRLRGQALVDLMQEYQQAGFEIIEQELPDYLPLFLEFLSKCDAAQAAHLLGEAIHIIAHIGAKLTQHHSPYAGLFNQLVMLSPVIPLALDTPPVRDMDEALITFGANHEGLEPLLHHSAAACQRCANPMRKSK